MILHGSKAAATATIVRWLGLQAASWRPARSREYLIDRTCPMAMRAPGNIEVSEAGIQPHTAITTQWQPRKPKLTLGPQSNRGDQRYP